MKNYDVNQIILRHLKRLYPVAVATDEIAKHPALAALQVSTEQVVECLNELTLHGFVMDSYSVSPAFGHMYKITADGLDQIDRRKFSPVVWGAAAL